MYTGLLPEQVKSYLASFQVAYPTVKVQVVRESPGRLIDRLLTERQNPQADVIWGLAVTSLVLFEWYDMLVPYIPAGLTRVPPYFRDVHTPPYWVGITAWIMVFCVNRERLDQDQLPLPVAWRDLSNPVYRGHLVLQNPVTASTGYLMVDTVLQHYGKIEGWEYLDALHQSVVKYASSSEELRQLVGTGEGAIGVATDVAAIQLQAAGMPIEVIFPMEGSGWDMLANALVKRQSLTIKPAAKTFLDWAISDGAMQAYRENFSLTAVRMDSLPPLGLLSDAATQLFDKDIMRSATHRDCILQE